MNRFCTKLPVFTSFGRFYQTGLVQGSRSNWPSQSSLVFKSIVVFLLNLTKTGSFALPRGLILSRFTHMLLIIILRKGGMQILFPLYLIMCNVIGKFDSIITNNSDLTDGKTARVMSVVFQVMLIPSSCSLPSTTCSCCPIKSFIMCFIYTHIQKNDKMKLK